MDLLTKADVVFAQRVDKSYGVPHLGTDALKRHFGLKVISWPNAFFVGQTPGLCYATGNAGKKVIGPLHDYQYRPIIDQWQQGVTVDRCVSNIELEVDRDSLVKSVERSFELLRSREDGLDVICSDLIDLGWQNKRMFFTFNHPCLTLLMPLAKRLLDKASICSLQFNLTSEVFGEPLNQIIPPISNLAASALGLSFDTCTYSKGVEVSILDNKVVLGKSRVYSLRELVEATFRSLEAQKNTINGIRFTPA
jgi:hypothetical protein